MKVSILHILIQRCSQGTVGWKIGLGEFIDLILWIVEVYLSDLNSNEEYPTCILRTQHDSFLIIKVVNGGIKTLLLGVTS